MRVVYIIAMGGLLLAGPLAAMAQDRQKVVPATEVPWVEAPSSIPPGAHVALLYGDPSKQELFVMRLKMPAGYKIPPHSHPKPEVITVLSGTVKLGIGETADEATAQTMPAGSFYVIPPNTAHFTAAVEETVIQLSVNGPWGINYVSPKEDPRQSQ
jgi:quercetin dioxygenase-like cupin family protein